MPTLELADGTMMGQSVAIANFIGKRHGFYPTDDMLAYKNDAIIDYLADRAKEIMGPAFAKEEEKAKLIDVSIDESFPKLMANLDSFIPETGFLLGDKLHVCDFFVGGLYVNVFTNPKGRFGIEDGRWAAALAKYPKFDAYGKRFAEANKEWLEKRMEATL